VVLVEVFAAIAAENLHLKTARHYLPFVAVLESVVLRLEASVVVELPALCLSAVGRNLDDGAACARIGVVESEGIVERNVAERV